MIEHLPVDSPMNAVARAGGAIAGVVLLGFGVLGFLHGVKFFSREGEKLLGLHTNGLLSLISVVFGLVLIAAAVIGRYVAATTNTVVAVFLIASGVVNLGLVRTDANFLAFRVGNVIFSFVVGVWLLTCGLYGRVTAGQPPGDQDRPLGSRAGGS